MQRTELERIAKLEDRLTDMVLANHQKDIQINKLAAEIEKLKEEILVLQAKQHLEIKYPLDDEV